MNYNNSIVFIVTESIFLQDHPSQEVEPPESLRVEDSQDDTPQLINRMSNSPVVEATVDRLARLVKEPSLRRTVSDMAVIANHYSQNKLKRHTTSLSQATGAVAPLVKGPVRQPLQRSLRAAAFTDSNSPSTDSNTSGHSGSSREDSVAHSKEQVTCSNDRGMAETGSVSRIGTDVLGVLAGGSRMALSDCDGKENSGDVVKRASETPPEIIFFTCPTQSK